MHIHRWSHWQDVKISDKPEAVSLVPGFIWYRQIITQQRRCSTCNMVKTRTT